MTTDYAPEKVPADELTTRMNRLRNRMNQDAPDWQLVIVMTQVNLFYLTGTTQNGVLVIPRNEAATYWVKRSYVRALQESAFADIRPIHSFREAADAIDASVDTVYLETESIPLAQYSRLNKHFRFKHVAPLDPILAFVRSIKSDYELQYIRLAGAAHHRVLAQQLPRMLQCGMSETELATQIMTALIHEGHHAINRVRAFNAELFLGQICFGTSALIANPFNGPGGIRGFGPSAPVFGSPDITLSSGDIVSVDTGCNIQGYHTDKTITHVFDGAFSPEAADAHQRCLDIEEQAAAQLRPGAIPSRIYEQALAALPEKYLDLFMGTGHDQTPFLGHGVGLEIDEFPVLARGFDDTIRENMVIALEPKIWVPDCGMVGSENTYRVTKNGGELLT